MYTMFLIPFVSAHLFYNADMKMCQCMKLVFFGDAFMEHLHFTFYI